MLQCVFPEGKDTQQFIKLLCLSLKKGSTFGIWLKVWAKRVKSCQGSPNKTSSNLDSTAFQQCDSEHPTEMMIILPFSRVTVRTKWAKSRMTVPDINPVTTRIPSNLLHFIFYILRQGLLSHTLASHLRMVLNSWFSVIHSLPGCWDYRCVQPHPASCLFYRYHTGLLVFSISPTRVLSSKAGWVFNVGFIRKYKPPTSHSHCQPLLPPIPNTQASWYSGMFTGIWNREGWRVSLITSLKYPCFTARSHGESSVSDVTHVIAVKEL